MKSKQQVALFLACNADDIDEPLVTGKYTRMYPNVPGQYL